MTLTVCFYEDEKYRQFFPLTLTRPVYTLRAGIVPLFQRIERYFPNAKVCLAARDRIAPFLSTTFKHYPVNIIKRGEMDILFVNGRVRTFGDLPEVVPQTRVSTIFTNRNEVVAVFFKAAAMKKLPSISTQMEYEHLIRKESDAITLLETTATLYHYCWEIIADIETEIHADFEHLKSSFPQTTGSTIHKGAFLVNQSNILLGHEVNILPGAVIDA
ncbi:MAG: putative sugar nucleotidyl transferase, partial [Candidatus Zixiibacteriota bacterium]